MSTYTSTNITFFKLNGDTYCIHNFVLEKMSIFNVIFEDKIADSTMLELTFPVSNDAIKNVFGIMYCSPIQFSSNEIKYALEVVSFMKYLGIDVNIVTDVSKCLMKDKEINEFINACQHIKYHPDLLLFIEYLDTNNVYVIRTVIDKILSLKYPLQFTEKIINTIVYKRGCAYNLDVTFEMCARKKIDSLHITSYYKKYDIDINSYSFVYDQEIISIAQLFETKIPIIKKFIVDGKEIKIITDYPQNNNNLVMINLRSTIAAHITNLLLGLETL